VEQPLEGKSAVTEEDVASYPGLDVSDCGGNLDGKLEEFMATVVLFTKFCIFVVETPTLPARRS
jgi:hypothetical protein